MSKKNIVFLAVIILILGWFKSESIAVSNVGLEEILNIFASVSQDKREIGAVLLNTYLKDMDKGVDRLKEDMDFFLNEGQKEKLENMGYTLDNIKVEMDILKKWNLNERKSLITYINDGNTSGIKALVNSAGKTPPSIPDNTGNTIQPSNPGNSTKPDNAGNVIEPSKGDTTIKEDEVLIKDENLLEVLFKDIESHINKDDIVYLAQRGIIEGKTSEIFDPNGQLTRAEFVTLIRRTLNLKHKEDKVLPFIDVDKGIWYYDAVKSAFDNEIIKGTSSTTFSPKNKVSREAMVSIVMRVLNNRGITFSLKDTGKDILMFKDADSISNWANQDMFYGVKYGIINGRTRSTLNPKEFATRGEAAEIIKELYDITRS